MRIPLNAKYFSNLYQTTVSLNKNLESSLCHMTMFGSKPGHLIFIHSKVTVLRHPWEAPLRDMAILGR